MISRTPSECSCMNFPLPALGHYQGGGFYYQAQGQEATPCLSSGWGWHDVRQQCLEAVPSVPST